MTNEGNIDPDASAEQIAWCEIANAVRSQLINIVKTMPAMDPSEIEPLVGAIRDAMWLEINAAGYDHLVELELERTN